MFTHHGPWLCQSLPLMIVVCFAPLAFSQSTTAEVFGTLRDASGGVVESAHLEFLNVATGAVIRTATSGTGTYQVLALPAGRYRLSVARTGFAPLLRENIVLRLGERLELNLELAIGDSTQAVDVTAAMPLLQSTRGGVSFLVDQQKVVTLPLDGRNFVPLIALSPGVSLPPGSLLPRINGSRPRVSEYLYDGISVLQPEPGQVAFYPVIDAVDEFRVETNSYSAEFGRSNGGVIMVNQKSGSNQLHGTLFEFFRNEKLNARNLFAPSGPTPRFRRNQYGFVLGGPLRRNTAFFFVDWQGTRLNTGVVRTSTVPMLPEREGHFAVPVFDPATTTGTGSAYSRLAFPSNTIPAQRFDAAAAAAIGRYPHPNVFTVAGAASAANNYVRVGNDTTAADQFDIRIDRYPGRAHRVFARYSFLRDDTRPTTPLPDGSGSLVTGVLGNTLTRADALAAEHSWTITPSAVNQLRFGFTRRAFHREAMRTGQNASEASRVPNIPVTSFPDVLPTFDIVGLQQLGPPSNGNAHFSTSVTQFIDSLSMVKGPHTVKIGVDLRRETLDVLQPPSPTGNFQFSNLFTAGLTPAGTLVPGTGHSFASFLLGQVGRFNVDAQPETLRPRAAISEFFVQDDVRATRKLTLNLGVRYTLNFPSTVLGDRGAIFNLTTESLQFLGANGAPRSARDLEKANFGPRVGIAYRIADSLVLRAGYGMTWIEQAGITTPFTTPHFPFIQTLSQQSLDNIIPAFVLSDGPTVTIQSPGPDSGLGQGVFGVQRANGSGYAQQWNATLQKTIGQNWSLEMGYLGSKLTRLGVPDINLNQLTAGQLMLGTQLLRQVPNPFYGEIPANLPLGAPTLTVAQLLRPYPRFTTVTLYRNNIGHSTYHSFQSRIEKRFSRGLTLTAAYTLSRLIDDAGAVFDSALLTGPATNYQAADSHNKRLEKDVSTGNIPHIFSSTFVYEFPWRNGLGGGWQIAGIVRAQSGSPVPITQATNLNAFAGFGIQRPNRVADPELPSARRSASRWFDTAAFRQAPQFSLGNSSRNPVTGPGYTTVDLMLAKSFAISERWRAEFRAEVFNLANTPPLGNPNGSFGTAAFGSITTALDPRVFELVIKLRF